MRFKEAVERLFGTRVVRILGIRPVIDENGKPERDLVNVDVQTADGRVITIRKPTGVVNEGKGES